MATTARLLTYDDYAAMPDDGKRYELIGGELFEMPSPSAKHQELVIRLLIALRSFVGAGKLGRVLVAPFDSRLSSVDVLQPDVLYVTKARNTDIGPNYLEGGPDLAVEVLSPSTRVYDLGVKMRLYAEANVQELWIGDVDTPELSVLRLENGSYVPIPPIAGIIESVVLPGLRLDVNALLADLDQMG